MRKTIKELNELTGGLSIPSKMPCYSYNWPAKYCQVGMRLQKIVNSVCSVCYAYGRGRYGFLNVKNALERRYKIMMNDPNWTANMTELITRKEKKKVFRWADSGDVQSVEHLEKLATIARATPEITYWLPTKEYSYAEQFLKRFEKPKNLTIRLSAFMIGGKPPTNLAKKLGLVTSGVTKGGFSCPSSKQGNKCLDCRACWDYTVENVDYKLH